MSKKRSYTLRKRADAQERTRLRIVEATVHLHEELGPRATTIRAIAERAGVQRLTVYRHFPDEAAVFRACTSHWLSLHPLPELALWADCEDAIERARTALIAYYRYYRQTQRMWTVAYRDEPIVPALQGPMQEVHSFLAQVGDDLFEHFPPGRRNKRLAATLRHALEFRTWRSLTELGLDEKEQVETVLTWITAARDDQGLSHPARQKSPKPA